MEQFLVLIIFGGLIVYFGYSYLVEGYKGLFKGRMNLKIRRPPGDNYINGVYARIWGAIYLIFGIFVAGSILFFLNSVLSSFNQ